jgi:predicted nucleic acid-binding Zn ribbon protein
MSMSTCRECGWQVNTESRTCHNCGAPAPAVSRRNRRVTRIVLAVAVLLAVALWLYYR